MSADTERAILRGLRKNLTQAVLKILLGCPGARQEWRALRHAQQIIRADIQRAHKVGMSAGVYYSRCAAGEFEDLRNG